MVRCYLLELEWRAHAEDHNRMVLYDIDCHKLLSSSSKNEKRMWVLKGGYKYRIMLVNQWIPVNDTNCLLHQSQAVARSWSILLSLEQRGQTAKSIF